MSPIRSVALAAAAMLLASCGGGGGDSAPSASGGGTTTGGGTSTPVVQVAIVPTEVEVKTAATFQFGCNVTGSTNTQCTWTVQESGGGSISGGGLYTAPATAGTYHVVAASAADASKTATALVRVTAQSTGAASPWVTGYYAGWFWDQMYPPEQVDMTAMTHFVFGRVAPGGGSLGGAAGTVQQGAGTAHQAKLSPDGVRSVEDYLIKKAHDSGTKTLLMLGGDGGDGEGFLRSTTDAQRPNFVKTVVDYMVAHDYDGVDVDWENALDGDNSQNVSATEARRRLIALIGDLRTEANKRSRYQTNKVLVTYPGYAVSINFLQPGGKVEQWRADVANRVDQYNLMSYGIGTAYNGGGWSSWFTGPIFGATGATPYDLDTSIKAYVATGVPRSKLGIGIGFYGIYYGPKITGPRQSTEGNDIFEVNDNALGFSELTRKGYLSNGTYKWDDVAKVGYRTYGGGGYIPSNDRNANPAGFLSYENEQSIAAKGDWVRQTGLGGTIIWTINYGYLSSSKTNPLLSAVKSSFLKR